MVYSLAEICLYNWFSNLYLFKHCSCTLKPHVTCSIHWKSIGSTCNLLTAKSLEKPEHRVLRWTKSLHRHLSSDHSNIKPPVEKVLKHFFRYIYLCFSLSNSSRTKLIHMNVKVGCEWFWLCSWYSINFYVGNMEFDCVTTDSGGCDCYSDTRKLIASASVTSRKQMCCLCGTDVNLILIG